ncbi:hypothetical protein [Streptomyces malaysiensis]|uniref:hypothetical protein n=1 Tax=Streptomyces malaysiensis TaxID=92644 RepID=UPI002B3241CA|nr:hypothetical protein R8789_00505 [Streptomyces malaysiensis]
MDTTILFWPRSGSAQVIRYLLRELNSRGHTTRLHELPEHQALEQLAAFSVLARRVASAAVES